MSQIDYLIYIPILFWVIVMFSFWYILLLGIIIPKLYGVLRVRKLFEFNLWINILKKFILLILVGFFNSYWINKEIKKIVKILHIFTFLNFFLKNNKYSYYFTKKIILVSNKRIIEIKWYK